MSNNRRKANEKLATKVPSHTLAGLDRYIRSGHRPGSFLQAVLSNKLFRTFELADQENQHAVRAIVMYLYNVAPSGCYGSERIMNEWISSEGLSGMRPGMWCKYHGIENCSCEASEGEADE